MGVIGALASGFSNIWKTFSTFSSFFNLFITSFFTLFNMFFTINFFLFLVGTWIFYRLIIKPFLLVRYYARQGATSSYIPIVGDFGPLSLLNNFALMTKGDIYYRAKKMIQKNPDMKAICTNLGQNVAISFVDPNLIKDFLIKQDFYIKAKHMLGELPEIANHGLLLVSGDSWKRVRKLLQGSLNHKFVYQTLPMWQVVLNTRFDLLAKEKNLNNIDILPVIFRILGELWGRLFFGNRFLELKFENGNTITEELEWVNYHGIQLAFSPWTAILGPKFAQFSFWPWHRKVHNRIMNFRKTMYRFILDEKQRYLKAGHPEPGNFLHAMFETQKNRQEYISDWELVDQFVNIFGDGFNTTGQAVHTILYWLGQFPEIREKIFEEASNSILNKEHITFDQLNQMKFTDAFIKECLRMNGPIAMLLAREAVEDNYIGEFLIKKGTLVTVEPPFINSNPKFHENPEKFDVQRWLDPNSLSSKTEPYAFLPFSAGPRTCLGFQTGLALAEIKMFLGYLLQHFDFTVVEGYKPRMTWGFLYEPANHVRLNMSPKT